jgi:hypothetical protein
MAMSARRALTSATLASTAAAGLLAATAIPASAATAATFNHLSTAKVLKALPSSAQLPSGVKLAGKVSVSKVAATTPCGTATPKVTFSGAAGVAAVYSAGKVTSTSDDVTVWTVSAAVFTSTPKATTAARALLVADGKCKASVTEQGITLTHTVAAPDSAQAGLWQGFRGVAHLSDPAEKVSLRVWTTWFVRGNVLLAVTEAAPIAKSTQAAQDAARKAVVNATLANLDKAAL